MKLVRQLIANRDIRLAQQEERVSEEFAKCPQPLHGGLPITSLEGQRRSAYQEQQRLRSLGAALRHRTMEEFKKAHWSAGGKRVKPAAALAERPTAPIRDPFDTVEFDAHRLDLRLKIFAPSTL